VREVVKARFFVSVDPAHPREYVAQARSYQATVLDPLSPIVCAVFLRAERQHASQFFDGVRVEKFHLRFAVVVFFARYIYFHK